MPQSHFLICYQREQSLYMLCLEDNAESTSKNTIWAPAAYSTKEEALGVFKTFRAELAACRPDTLEFQALINQLAEMNAIIACFEEAAQHLQPFIVDLSPYIPAKPLIRQPYALLKLKREFLRFKVADVLEEILNGTITSQDGSIRLNISIPGS